METLIQSLWVGNRLSTMERLSISSFLRQGHEFHLYVYEDVLGTPKGVVLRDGNEILPSSSIFTYSRQTTYAGFANFFRYKLLLEKGGWWVDLDTVCLESFEFPEPYVFSSEIDDGVQHVNNGMMKASRGSAAMEYLWQECRRVDPQEMTWGQCGPQLMRRAIELFSLEGYVAAPDVFCPIPWPQWSRLLDPGISWLFGEETRSVHLWNEMWRRAGKDKDWRYDPTSLYEVLKKKFLGGEALTNSFRELPRHD